MARNVERLFDEYLAASARAGDRHALARLACRWQDRFYAFAWRRTGDRELAAEVAQDAWLDIVKGIRRLDDAAAFSAWAYRILARRAADAIRKRQRRRLGEAALAAEQVAVTDPSSQMEALADRTPLLHAINRLSADHQTVVVLFYREGLTVTEIAAALETPVGTIKTRLMHAREKLKSALGGNSEGGPPHDQS